MYTKRGDAGETGLYGSKRVRKDAPRVEAYGNVDELNSCVGLAISASKHPDLTRNLSWVQGRLFVSGADLATELSSPRGRSTVPRIAAEDTKRLEGLIDDMQDELPRLTNFILPGGGELSARLHLARSVCRRAERSVVALSRVEKLNPELIPFLNRLSTYLFNAARLANHLDGEKEEVWRKD